MDKKRLTIVCVGGKVIENRDSLKVLIRDFAALKGARLLVHGGGEIAFKVASRMNLKVRNDASGSPIIDNDMIDVMSMVHGGLINKRLVALLERANTAAIGLTGADMRLLVAARAVGDVGWKGNIKRVNTTLLQNLLDKEVVPVIAPLAGDANAQTYYVDEDEITAEVARVLSLTRDITIVYITDRNGVLMNELDPDSVIASLSRTRYANLKEMGIIAGGMVPKIDSAFSSIDHGVKQVYVTSVDRLAHLEQATRIK